MRHAPQRNTRFALCAVLLACSGSAALAQSSLQQAMLRLPATIVAADVDGSVSTPPTSVAEALQQLAQRAAVVFTGSVSTVTPDAGSGAKVTFVVEQAVRGVVSGAGYSIRVSAWAGGADRYFPGERALFLLTAPSASGFSAPVMGEHGIVPLSGDALVGNLDLRWIATEIQRAQQPADQDDAASAAVALAVVAASAERRESAAVRIAATSPENTGSLVGVPDVHAIDRDLLLDLLRSGSAAPGLAR